MDVTGKLVGKKGDDHEEDSRSLRPGHRIHDWHGGCDGRCCYRLIRINRGDGSATDAAITLASNRTTSQFLGSRLANHRAVARALKLAGSTTHSGQSPMPTAQLYAVVTAMTSIASPSRFILGIGA